MSTAVSQSMGRFKCHGWLAGYRTSDWQSFVSDDGTYAFKIPDRSMTCSLLVRRLACRLGSRIKRAAAVLTIRFRIFYR